MATLNPPPAPDRRKQDCSTCPSYVSTSNPSSLGYFTYSAACGKYRIPLATIANGSTFYGSQEIFKHMRETCRDYGKPVDSAPADPDAVGRIATPMPPSELAPVDSETDRAESCTGCLYYNHQVEMLNRFGMPVQACSATGTIIPIGKAIPTATQCSHNRRIGADQEPVLLDPDRLVDYLGEKTVVLDIPEAPVRVGTTAADLHPDPTTYVSDREVGADDAARGIRAWRKLVDPDSRSKHFVWMPIFDPEFFTDDERALIPQAGASPDDAHPESYDDHAGLLYLFVVLWTQLNQTPALIGPAGTGKTEAFRHAAWAMQLPFHRIAITASTELDELVGRMELKPGYTEFHHGRVSRAWIRPGVIAIDEPNTGPPDVWQFLRPLTDSRELFLDVDHGQRLMQHQDCYMGMSFNPAYDIRNVGTHEIGEADASRLSHIALPVPPPDKEREIIARACLRFDYRISAGTLDAIMAVAAELRALAADEAFPTHWGLRDQIKVALFSRWWPLERAYRLAMADYLEPTHRDQLLGIVAGHNRGGRR